MNSLLAALRQGKDGSTTPTVTRASQQHQQNNPQPRQTKVAKIREQFSDERDLVVVDNGAQLPVRPASTEPVSRAGAANSGSSRAHTTEPTVSTVVVGTNRTKPTDSSRVENGRNGADVVKPTGYSKVGQAIVVNGHHYNNNRDANHSEDERKSVGGGSSSAGGGSESTNATFNMSSSGNSAKNPLTSGRTTAMMTSVSSDGSRSTMEASRETIPFHGAQVPDHLRQSTGDSRTTTTIFPPVMNPQWSSSDGHSSDTASTYPLPTGRSDTATAAPGSSRVSSRVSDGGTDDTEDSIENNNNNIASPSGSVATMAPHSPQHQHQKNGISVRNEVIVPPSNNGTRAVKQPSSSSSSSSHPAAARGESTAITTEQVTQHGSFGPTMSSREGSSRIGSQLGEQTPSGSDSTSDSRRGLPTFANGNRSPQKNTNGDADGDDNISPSHVLASLVSFGHPTKSSPSSRGNDPQQPRGRLSVMSTDDEEEEHDPRQTSTSSNSQKRRTLAPSEHREQQSMSAEDPDNYAESLPSPEFISVNENTSSGFRMGSSGTGGTGTGDSSAGGSAGVQFARIGSDTFDNPSHDLSPLMSNEINDGFAFPGGEAKGGGKKQTKFSLPGDAQQGDDELDSMGRGRSPPNKSKKKLRRGSHWHKVDARSVTKNSKASWSIGGASVDMGGALSASFPQLQRAGSTPNSAALTSPGGMESISARPHELGASVAALGDSPRLGSIGIDANSGNHKKRKYSFRDYLKLARRHLDPERGMQRPLVDDEKKELFALIQDTQLFTPSQLQLLSKLERLSSERIDAFLATRPFADGYSSQLGSATSNDVILGAMKDLEPGPTHEEIAAAKKKRNHGSEDHNRHHHRNNNTNNQPHHQQQEDEFSNSVSFIGSNPECSIRLKSSVELPDAAVSITAEHPDSSGSHHGHRKHQEPEHTLPHDSVSPSTTTLSSAAAGPHGAMEHSSGSANLSTSSPPHELAGGTGSGADVRIMISSDSGTHGGSPPPAQTKKQHKNLDAEVEDGNESLVSSPTGSEGTRQSSISSKNSFLGDRRNSASSSNSSSRSTRNSAAEYGFASFVSDLALSSFQLSVHDEPVVVDVEVDAAMLFIDISGYSRISSALESKGAFALFSIVNTYVSMLVDIVVEFNGQVVKFAGDAIKCVWYFKEKRDSVAAALHCADELQKRCGRYEIEGTEHHFSIHIGVVSGKIRSTVFQSKSVKNMENTYHLISGKPLHIVGDVVDAARPGEICVSDDVLAHACEGLITSVRCHASDQEGDAATTIHLVEDIDTDSCTCNPHLHRREVFMDVNPQEHDIGNEVELDLANRNEHITAFVPLSIAQQLRKGKTQSEMAEMRLLTILFIHKTDSTIDIADWFEEVQHVIDEFRCAIVQIIEDDKGVHVIAAVNLFNADREPAVTGIKVANALILRQCGCTMGIATGITFCGVVGNTAAARFDVTGWACVRACRLMQWALTNNEPVAIGESVVQYSGDLSMTTPLGTTHVKGSKDAVKVFGIAQVDTSILSSITTAGTACPNVHRAEFERLRDNVVSSPKQRIGCVVRGSSNSGKHTLCARSVYATGIVSFTHVGVQDSRQLDLLWTIGKWFVYHRDPEVRELAGKLLAGLDESHNIRSTAIALNLVKTTIKKGMKNAVIIRHCQRLDAMSMSFVRQILHAEPGEGDGRFLVMATVVPQCGAQAWSAIATTMGANTLTFRIGHLSSEEAKAFVTHRLKWSCDHQLERAVLLASGKLVGLIESVITKLETIGDGKMTVSTNGELRCSDSLRKELFLLGWQGISRQICAKYAQIFSGLSVSAAAVTKVAALLSTPFFPISRAFAAATSAKIISGVKSRKIIKEIEFLVDMYLLEKRGSQGMAKYGGGGGSGNARRASVASNRSHKGPHTPMKGNTSNMSGASLGHSPAPASPSGAASVAAEELTEDFVEFESPSSLSVYLETVLPNERIAVGLAAIQEFETYHDLETPEEYFTYAHHFHNAGRPEDYKKMIREGLALLAQLESKIEPDDAHQLRLRLAIDMRLKGYNSLTFATAATEVMRAISPDNASSPPRASMSICLDDLNSGTTTSSTVTPAKKSSSSALSKWKSISTSVAKELPPHIVKLKTWRPPISFGALNMALRQSSIFITELAVNAAMQRPTEEEKVKANWARINLYVKFKEQIDRVVGFEAPIPNEKEFLIHVGTPTSDFSEVCAYGREFLEYIDSTVIPRADRVMNHVMKTMYVPYSPSYKPVFTGVERVSLETALKNSLKNWEADSIGSLRDGLMEIATQGWVPKNPEQNIEYQRDCYLRKRTQLPECFLCLLFVNLSISTI